MATGNLKKKWVLILLFSAICLAKTSAQETKSASDTENATSPKVALTLEKALEIAFDKGPMVKISEMDILKSKYDSKSVWATLLPRIDASGDYGYTIKKQVMYLGGKGSMPSFPGMPDLSKGIEVGRTHNINGGVTIGMPLIAPQLWNSLKLNKQMVESALLESELSKVSLTNNVTKAFYALMLAEESFKVMELSWNYAKSTYEDASKKYEAGIIPLYDKIRAEVQMGNIEPNLVKSRNAVSSARYMLNILMGVDIETPTTISPLEEGFLEREMSVEAEEMKKGVLSMISNNIDLKKTDQQIKMLKTQESLAKSAYLPSLSLGGYYRVSAMDDTFVLKDYQWTPSSAVSLSLKIPIFSGGERLMKLKKAKLTTDQAMLRRELQKNNLLSEAITLNQKLEGVFSNMQSARNTVTMAEKGYQIAKKRYETGASTLVELNDAELALLQARLNYQQIIYEFFSLSADKKKMNGYYFQTRDIEQ